MFPPEPAPTAQSFSFNTPPKRAHDPAAAAQSFSFHKKYDKTPCQKFPPEPAPTAQSFFLNTPPRNAQNPAAAARLFPFHNKHDKNPSPKFPPEPTPTAQWFSFNTPPKLTPDPATTMQSFFFHENDANPTKLRFTPWSASTFFTTPMWTPEPAPSPNSQPSSTNTSPKKNGPSPLAPTTTQRLSFNWNEAKATIPNFTSTSEPATPPSILQQASLWQQHYDLSMCDVGEYPVIKLMDALQTSYRKANELSSEMIGSYYKRYYYGSSSSGSSGSTCRPKMWNTIDFQRQLDVEQMIQDEIKIELTEEGVWCKIFFLSELGY